MNASRTPIRRLFSSLAAVATAVGVLVIPTPIAAFHSGPEPMLQEARGQQSPEGLTKGEWKSIRQMIREAQYHVTWQQRDGEWAFRAPNKAQQMSVAFGPDGSEATRYEVDGSVAWKFGLSLQGFAGETEREGVPLPGAARVSAPASPKLRGKKDKVEYQWGDSLTEWYENRPDGVKHGITIAGPPDVLPSAHHNANSTRIQSRPGNLPGPAQHVTDGRADCPAYPEGHEGVLTLTYAIHGSLTPQLDKAGQVLRLRNARGSVELLYDQLAVFDAKGRELPSL